MKIKYKSTKCFGLGLESIKLLFNTIKGCSGEFDN